MPIFNFFLIVFISLMVGTGFFEFSIWGQVYDVKELNYEGSNIRDFYYHIPRYLLVYPAFLLNGLFPSVAEDKWYSFYIIVMFIFTVFMLSKIYLRHNPHFLGFAISRHASFSIIFFVMLPLLFFINGRAMFGIFSASMLLYFFTFYMSFHLLKNILLVFGSVLFSLVSSGFIVIALFSILVIGLVHIRFLSKIGIYITLSALFIFYLSYDFIVYVFHKNIDFFGGGFVGVTNMLDHGFGMYFKKLSTIWLGGISTTIFIFTLILFWKVPKSFFVTKTHIIIVFIFSIEVGMFGYTSLAYGIPSLVLLSLTFFSSSIMALINNRLQN